ncbi:MAG TPA: extracellular solute-binding protein [Cellulomonas sp.]
MKTRHLAPIAALAVGALALTGCSSSGGDDDGTTLELWTAWTEGAATAEASEEMIAQFEQETGYTVNQTNFTYDMLHEKLIASAAGGNLPDVVWGLPEYVGELSSMGILADLTDAWDSWEDKDQVSDAVKSAMSINGQVVGFPYETTVRAYLVHDDLLAAAGVDVPTTWDEVLEIGSSVQDATGSSFFGVAGTGVRAPQELLVYLAQSGASIAEEQSDGGFRNTWQEDDDQLAAATRTFQFYLDLFDSGAVNANSATYGWEDTDENFATALTASYVTGNWLAEREETNTEMSDVSVHAIPAPADGVAATYLESKPVFVMNTSDDLEAATELARTWASHDWQEAAFADRSALADVSTDSKWSEDFGALTETGVTFPPVTLSSITQAMIDALARVLQEGDDPEATAIWLSEQVNASLEASGELAG